MKNAPSHELVEIHLPESGGFVFGEQQIASRNWVGLVHGPGESADLGSWRSLRDALVTAGFSTLAIDLPGHGLSEGKYDLNIAAECLDSILAHMQSQGSSRRFLILEGEVFAALCKLDSLERIDDLVLLSPVGNYEEAKRLPTCPKLFVHGNADQTASERVDELFRVCRGWTVQSGFGVSKQGTDLLASSWERQITTQIVGFLKDYGDWS